MRIVSLLPSATEIVCALGLEDALVGITHECDYPPAVRGLPAVTRSLLDHSESSSEEIDHHVSRRLHDGLSLYALDAALLGELRPDLIITQALCPVCGVEHSAVQHAARDVASVFGGAPRVLSLEPRTLADIFVTLEAVGAAAGVEQRAAQLVGALQARVERVRERAASALTRPRVAFLEWMDPAYGPGQWAPELIALAGGRVGFGQPGADSHRVPWDDVIAFAPEVIVVAPCGFTLPRALAEAREVLPRRHGWSALPAVRRGRVYVADGNAYFSRPSPRIVDSLELLAELVQPELFAGWGPQGAWQTLAGS
ncbi:MAG TPA: cobalamin-binding protein [Roseiflexaceae bacterium]|nr:cobalamin-binding protein [Roseiflexaceae bacterium]